MFIVISDTFFFRLELIGRRFRYLEGFWGGRGIVFVCFGRISFGFLFLEIVIFGVRIVLNCLGFGFVF